jgi:hypothetical protein
MTKRDTTREWELLFKENGEEIDVDELTTMLDAYTVEFPPEHIIQSTIDQSLIHLRQSTVDSSRYLVKLDRLFQMLSIQTEYLAKWFWFFSALLFMSGYLMTIYGSLNPYKAISVLSPMPFVLGVLELFRGVESGMAEIELACKMSLPQTVMVRFALIGSYNIVLNSLISLGLYWGADIDFGRVVLFWMVPFTWISSIVLLLATKIRGRLLVPVALSVWAIAVTGLLLNRKVLPYLLSLNVALFVLFAMVGCILLLLQARHLYNRTRGGMLIEITD